LATISNLFNLVEINTTFYRIPPCRNVEKWVSTVHDVSGFRFNVKLYRGFSHDRILDPELVMAFRKILNLFQDAGVLGCVLVQFPWSFKCRREEKIYIHKLLDSFSEFPLAVEVRHGSWNISAFFHYLRKQNVSFCNIDQPVIGQSLHLTSHVTAIRGYLRLHGRNRKSWFNNRSGRDERYNYLYTDAEIEHFVRLAHSMSNECDEIYIVTNNHYRGKAVYNAIQLSQRLIHGFSPGICITPADVE